MGTRAEICEREAKGPKAESSMRMMQNFNSVISLIVCPFSLKIVFRK